MDARQKATKAFLSPHTSADEALQRAQYASERGAHIHGAIVAFDGNERALMEKLDDGRSRLRGIAMRAASVPFIEVKRHVKQPVKGVRTARLIMIPDVDAKLLYFLSADSREDFDIATDVVLGRVWQSTARVFLRTRQVSKVLVAISRWKSLERMKVLEYTSRTVVNDSGIQRKVETERHWVSLSVDETFERLSLEGQWLSSILFSLRYEEEATRVRILRNGSFTCDTGFLAFWNDIRPTITEIIVETNKFFERRDKQSSPTGSIRPLRIAYTEPIFADKQANRRLIGTLKSMGSSSLSVWHPNPYLYASVLDYVDGSSCDVLVARHDAILVIPQFRASAASLQRVCDHICDNFQEGRIDEL